MEEAMSRHFHHHGKERYAEERNDCHWCQLRILPTQSAIPITVVNTVENSPEVLPNDFRFINDMVYGPGIQRAEDSFRSGCACEDNALCQFDGCSCLDDLADDPSSSDDEMDWEQAGDSGGPKKKYAYHAHGLKKGLLRSKVVDPSWRWPIYECHEGCSCSADCPNRVVERGRTIPLQIFYTDDGRGWGVRATETIEQGQFVDRYLGEIITSAEADHRRQTALVAKRKDNYLFALDKFSDPNHFDPRFSGPPLVVDGQFMSGPTRFVNHSCDPNMRIFARVGDHVDKHMHDLALFAIKQIPAGEELTFDYVDGQEDESPSQAEKKDMVECKCGSRKCRKFLW